MSDDEDGWAKAQPGAKGSGLGMSKDLLRKARAVNPDLAAQGSTTELFDKVQTAKSSPAAAKKPAAAARAPGDFFSTFYDQKERYETTRARLLEEKARVDRELAALAPDTCHAIVELVLASDPSIANPQTQEILQREQAFLAQVGFSHRKVVDRRLQKK
ncbi:MAG: hypothetical protein IT381_28395 [Deltaproteobacteria bacterium]|nr:hypothetical protein [Deltaproteobacteria bacterium]